MMEASFPSKVCVKCHTRLHNGIGILMMGRGFIFPPPEIQKMHNMVVTALKEANDQRSTLEMTPAPLCLDVPAVRASVTSIDNDIKHMEDVRNRLQQLKSDKAAFQDLMAKVKAFRKTVLAAATGAKGDIIDVDAGLVKDVEDLLTRLRRLRQTEVPKPPSASGVRLRK